MTEVLFLSLCFLKTYTFWKKLFCLIFKLLLTFLTFVEGFLYIFCPYFDTAFAQLVVIVRTRSKFLEIVAFAEGYLITNQVKNKESKKQPFQICFPVKLAHRRMPIKQERKFFVPNLQHFQFEQIVWKLFFIKAS